MHVYLRRALLSSQWFGDDGVQLARAAARAAGGGRWTFVTRPRRRSSAPASRAWLADHNPGLPASSTDDEYWARPGRVAHRALRRRLLRSELAVAVRRSRPPDRLRRHPRRRARGGRRAAAPEPRLSRAGHHRRTAATRSRTGSCPA